MYIDESSITRNGKTYTRRLLRKSYKVEGKVKKETIANLSHMSEEEFNAFRFALKQSKDPKKLIGEVASIELSQGQSIGALLAFKVIADEIGLTSILKTKEGQRLLWQVFARLINQGSRLSAVRLAEQHAVSTVLGLDKFNEDDLYENLDWAADNQDEIEEQLYKKLKSKTSELFLYDVTSSYLEGTQNELAKFGYNRDKKKGKMQIVIGLLCSDDGTPITVRVFQGNTPDHKSMSGLIEEASQRFGVKNVVWIGDRGMIKSTQVEQINSLGFNYITAITKVQIESLIKQDVIQLSLFDSELVEVAEGNIRYVLRRNPVRAKEISQNREDKYKKALGLAIQLTKYLKEHPKAKVDKAVEKLTALIKKLNLNSWLTIKTKGRTLSLVCNAQAKEEQSRLDGCYVLKTDLNSELASKEVIHDRYKDLALVESAFRACKTGHLELRPVYVRKESRTRGHVFVVLLAYRLRQVLEKRWASLNCTIEEGIKALCALGLLEVKVGDNASELRLPSPTGLTKQLLDALNVKLPKTVSSINQSMSTKKPLKRKRKRPQSSDLIKRKVNTSSASL